MINVSSKLNAKDHVVVFVKSSTSKKQVQEVLSSQYADLFQLFNDCLQGVLHLHTRNIVWNDLKQDNILCSNGRYQISDFGIALDMINYLLINSSQLGGTWYPPECITRRLRPGQKIIPGYFLEFYKIDTWALGVEMAYMFYDCFYPNYFFELNDLDYTTLAAKKHYNLYTIYQLSMNSFYQYIEALIGQIDKNINGINKDRHALLKNIIFMCLNFDPNARPNIKDLIPYFNILNAT